MVVWVEIGNPAKLRPAIVLRVVPEGAVLVHGQTGAHQSAPRANRPKSFTSFRAARGIRTLDFTLAICRKRPKRKRNSIILST